MASWRCSKCVWLGLCLRTSFVPGHSKHCSLFVNNCKAVGIVCVPRSPAVVSFLWSRTLSKMDLWSKPSVLWPLWMSLWATKNVSLDKWSMYVSNFFLYMHAYLSCSPCLAQKLCLSALDTCIPPVLGLNHGPRRIFFTSFQCAVARQHVFSSPTPLPRLPIDCTEY